MVGLFALNDGLAFKGLAQMFGEGQLLDSRHHFKTKRPASSAPNIELGKGAQDPRSCSILPA